MIQLTTEPHGSDRAAATGDWDACRFMTCSILPVRHACNLQCPFCFSKSSISDVQRDHVDWAEYDLDAYFRFSVERGASRLVITGGGEPLLKPAATLYLVERGAKYFDEIACFTNGTYLTSDLARRLRDAGLSYVCYSRHHDDDSICRELMGPTTPRLDEFFEAVGPLRVRATCVMAKGYVDSVEDVDRYRRVLGDRGVREFTFKHTYVAYSESYFGGSLQDNWALAHQVEFDPFAGRGEIVAELPWGPRIRRIGEHQVCYYHEPDPVWEKEEGICRSVNLLSDGAVYASLEDQQSLLFRLNRL